MPNTYETKQIQTQAKQLCKSSKRYSNPYKNIWDETLFERAYMAQMYRGKV